MNTKSQISASEAIGKHIAKGTIVVFESTVYPGLTEEICGAKIAEISGLKAGIDFHLGYSPERVNPGDKKHTIDKITKIVSGDTPEVTNLLSKVYGSVITAGIFSAASIKVAEAAKVIENTQRDINIALINELSQIFDRIGIDTLDVLQASGTKWNFLPFRPGLVGGHCIGVDPYYLTYVAEKLGIHPEVILAGRRINDNMAAFVAQKTIKLVLSSPKFDQEKLRIGILGVTFKENVPDLRNSKVADLVNEFKSYGADVDIFDPMVDEEELKHEYNLRLTKFEEFQPCHALVLAVPHTEFIECYPLEKLLAKTRNTRVLIDIKGALNRTSTQAEGVTIWRP